MKRSFYLVLFLASSFIAQAQTTLLKDINNSASTTGSNPNNYISFNGAIYYTANDGVTGSELWKTNGTSAGTVQVKDINPGDGSSSPTRFTIIGSFLYFRANDGENGVELWRTDGTTAGTKIVTDINPGAASSSPDYLTVINSTTLYFAATSVATGRELFKTDLTSLTTTLISDINTTTATASSSPSELVLVSGTTVYFAANDGLTGSELWKSDGTSLGTQRIKDIYASGTNGSFPAYLTLVGTTVVFQANDGTNGYEVWACSNGTAAGTTMIKDVNTTAVGASSYPSNFTKYGTLLYFTADDGGAIYGNEFWRTDGTSANTAILGNMASGTTSGNPYGYTVSGGVLYFSAYDPTSGYELWKYNSATSSFLTYNINLTASTGSNPNDMKDVNGVLYFSATTTAAGTEMYKMAGTSPVLVDVLNGSGSTYPYGFTGLGTDVLFSADAGSGTELWKYDGTTATQVIDLVSGSGSGDPFDFTSVTANGVTFFTATNGSSGYELWKTDGTTAGTTMLKDINPTGDSYPQSLTVVGSYVFFSAYDGGDSELWRTDGTAAGTVKIDIYPGAGLSSNPSGLVALNSTTLVFSAFEPTYGQELYKVVGTTAPQVINITSNPTLSTSSYPSYITVAGTSVYFQAYDATTGYELYAYNGTTLTRVSDIAAGTLSSYPYGMAAVGTTVYFQADNTGTGNNYELWKTTGTLASTALVKEINPSATLGSYPYNFYGFNGSVYFQADNGTNGYELWKSDGTAGGTVMVKDINTIGGTTSHSSPSSFYAFGGKLYFSARTVANGIEPWVTDGTDAGTILFKDLNPGAANGAFLTPVTLGSNMYFLGSDGTGARIFVTDGTACKTVLTPSYSGAATSSASEITLATFAGVQKIIFSMNAKGYEREPFILDPAGVTLPTAVAITQQPSPATVTMPATASLSVTATGTGLTYQWQKGGVNVPGATSATLNFATTTDTDAGLYKVIVTGTCGQLTSNEVQLTVNATTPTAQATGLTFTSPTTTSLGISFTAAVGTPSGYLVLRRKGSAPTETPVDGTVYAAGATLGLSTVVKSNAAISGNDTGLQGGSEYFYAVFSYNGSGTLIKYLTTSPLAGSSFTLAPEPAGQPTALVFSNVDGSTLSGSFTATDALRYLVIRKAGSAPTGVPADGKVYAAGDVLGDAVVAYLGDTPSFTDSGLTPETKYYYQVFAGNGLVSAINYNVTSPLQNNVTTISALPDAPTALRFTNITNNSFTVTFTAPTVNVPTAYIVLRNAGTSLTGVPVDGTTYAIGNTVGDARVAYVGPNTTFDENLPLVPLTYAVFPFNGTGASINYRTSAPLMGTIAPDNSPPVITDETTAAVDANATTVKVIVSISEPESSVQDVTVAYGSVSKGGTRTTVPLTFAANKWSVDVPMTGVGELGIEYTVSATNSLALTGKKDGQTGLIFSDQSFALTSFGENVANYRIISVPLDVTAKTANDIFGSELGNYDGISWRMYRYSGGATTELSGTTPIEPGKGYWLISKQNKTINTGAGKTVTASSIAPFSYNLVEGWNQIGNPYNFNLVWNDVKVASSLNLKLRVFTGEFTDADKLNKYQGGFVLANAAGKLVFPTLYNAAAGRTDGGGSKLMTNPIDQQDWEVILNVKQGDVKNPFGGIGMNRNANVAYDENDDFTLPRFVDFIELNHNKKLFNISYTKDVIPTVANYTWEFDIESNKNGATEITWDNFYFGANDLQLILWDEEASIPVDMRSATAYSFNQNGSRRFKIFYGDLKYVNEKASKDVLLIHNISPNPSVGEVDFTFTVPGTQQQFVEVKILNSLGQPVTSIFNGILAGGFHQMSWSGKDSAGARPSQGVYLVEILSNGEKVAKRVVLK